VRPDDEPTPRAPTLILNPRGDAEFEALARDLVTDGYRTPETLQVGLRSRYPQARVHARSLSGEFQVVLYVYRDGRWIPE
jgi:hypothetical protein